MQAVGASVGEIEGVYRSRAEGFFRLVCAQTGDAESARDAVQEGFANAVRGRASFRGEGPLDAWVARCVIDAALDASRASPSSRIRQDETESGESSADAGLLAAIRRLPPRQREALFLRYFLDFDYATIAATLSVESGLSPPRCMLPAPRSSLRDSLQEVYR